MDFTRNPSVLPIKVIDEMAISSKRKKCQRMQSTSSLNMPLLPYYTNLSLIEKISML